MKITINDTTIEVKRLSSDLVMYKKGGMICSVAPWSSYDCPLTLSVCICPDGEIINRGWTWHGDANSYLHTTSKPEDVIVTKEMRETVSGLFSGRIKIDGLNIGVGATVQNICPIDFTLEEKIWLA
jgi:hypothetical protein